MIKGPKKAISVVIPEELYRELRERAQGDSRPLSGYIRQVLRAHLEYIGRFRQR